MRLISWNVNGVRSVHKKGFLEWFATSSPDILCLQETRALESDYPFGIVDMRHTEMQAASAQKKGYSGVATFTKKKFLDTKKLGDEKFDDEGRTLIHDLGFAFLLNCYFPNSQRDHARLQFKLEYCSAILKKVKALRKTKPVIVTGDYNIAHHPIDLANPKSNKDTAGFLPEEREWLSKFEGTGMVDVFRRKNPELAGQYTWWSNRPGCREKNIGWRIDYFFVSEDLLPQVKRAEILPDVLGSDHCPIALDLNVKWT